VWARRLFGALNVYVGERHIGLLDRDRLFLKADEETRLEFEAAGMNPLQPLGEDPARPFYEVPADMLGHADALRLWAGKAVAAAERRDPPVLERVEPTWKIKRIKKRKKKKKVKKR
jgi:DNA transformation protein